MKKLIIFLSLLTFPLLFNATDVSRKTKNSKINGRIHAKKPGMRISMCDQKVITQAAQLYEQVIILQDKVSNLREENAALRKQLKMYSEKFNGGKNIQEQFAENWIS